MGRQGLTTKPCHGCGSRDYHAIGKVCSSCRTKLAESDVRREWLEKRSRLVLAYGPSSAHCLPYVHHTQARDERGYVLPHEQQPLELFRSAFLDLVHAIAEPVERSDAADAARLTERGDYSGYGIAKFLRMPKAVLALLRRLYAAVEVMVLAAYKEGQRDGHRLLTGLATGQYSVGEFNDGIESVNAKGR